MTGPDLRVLTTRLTDAAVAAKSIADTVRGADVAGPVRRAGAGLPGSGYTAAADGLAGQWSAAVTALADSVAQHSTALEASARSYRDSERHIADSLGAGPEAAGTGSPGPGVITRALG